MPINQSTGPLKFFNVVISYTEHNTVPATVAAVDAEEARLKVITQMNDQVDSLVVVSVTEIPLENDAPVDMDNLPDGVTKLSDHKH
jgi:hypothetical protein